MFLEEKNKKILSVIQNKALSLYPIPIAMQSGRYEYGNRG